MVVFFLVLPAKDFCLQKTGKKFHIEELVPEACVEAFAIGVLPWSTRFDVERLHTICCDPLFHCIGDELGAVVTTDELRYPSLLHQLLQCFQDIPCRDRAIHLQGEALAGVFIQNGEPLEATPSLGLIEDEVVAPDMIDPLGSLPLRPIGTLPKPSALAGAWRHLQPFLLPEPMNTLLVHDPSLSPQIAEDTPVSRTGFPCGKGQRRKP